MEIAKAHWQTDESGIRLGMPLTKVDVENRTVSGFASLDNPDTQDDVVLSDASVRAFSRFRGNIREMHQPVAVGKMVDFKEDELYDPLTKKFYRGIFVTVRVSKGAQDTWEKVLDGTLSGFSIGGDIIDAETQFVKDAGKTIRFVKDYNLTELSLVDNPANQLSNFAGFQKSVFNIETDSDGNKVLKGMIAEMTMETVFWCKDDQIAKTSTEDVLSCPNCGKKMAEAGFIETDGSDKGDKVADVIQKFTNPQDSPANDEGGVEVAEDTARPEAGSAVPAGTTDADEQGKAEVEVDSSVEEVVEADADAKDEETAEEVTEAPDATDDIAKMIKDVREAIAGDLSKNSEALTNAVAEVESRFEKFSSDLDTKISELSERHGELSKRFDSLRDEVGKMEKSIANIDTDLAVKKSGDLGGSTESTTLQKSKDDETGIWGGHFLVRNLND